MKTSTPKWLIEELREWLSDKKKIRNKKYFKKSKIDAAK